MESYVGSTIEKIKLQEQDNETKLKEKRELEATVLSLRRGIKEAAQIAEKTQLQNKQLEKQIDYLRTELIIQKTRRDALVAQLQACKEELTELRTKSDEEIGRVWTLRSSLCSAVQAVADECDIRALLIKPIHFDPLPISNKKHIQSVRILNPLSEDRLKAAIDRRNNAITERDRLKIEPDVGEEFIRVFAHINKVKNKHFCTNIEPNVNTPIKFSTSPAAKKTTIPVLSPPPQNMPWYQPYSVLGSVTVFLIYFCLLREENDVDLKFDKTLYDRIQGLEKQQLLESYKYNKEHGLSVQDIEIRLQELEANA